MTNWQLSVAVTINAMRVRQASALCSPAENHEHLLPEPTLAPAKSSAGLAHRSLGCVSSTIIAEEFSLFWAKSLEVQVQISVWAMQPHFPMSNSLQYSSWQTTLSVTERMCRHAR